MTTYDTTVSMLKKLPENDLRTVMCYIRNTFFKDKERDSFEETEYDPFLTVSEDEVFERLERTRMRIENGAPLMEAHQASSYVRKQYGLQ